MSGRNSVDTILAVDVGSSSVRCTAFEVTGRADSASAGLDGDGDLVRKIEGHSIELDAVAPTTGRIKINEILDAVDECVDETLGRIRQLTPGETMRVVSIGLTTFCMNLVGVDQVGEPVGESATLSYACNSEQVAQECLSLKQRLGEDGLATLHRRTGTNLHVSYAVPQIMAYYNDKSNSRVSEKIKRWQTISSLVLHRWSGSQNIRMPVSYSEASWTGMFNFSSCCWDSEVLEMLDSCEFVKACCTDAGFVSVLPEVVDFDEVSSVSIPKIKEDGTPNKYWTMWPELRSSTMHLGVGDGAAANLGSKCNGMDRIALTIGTSAAARICIPHSINDASSSISLPFGLWCYRVDRHRILIGGALTDGGSTIAWARSLLNLDDKAFDDCLGRISNDYGSKRLPSPVDTRQVSMIPFLGGERSTGFRTGARACVSNLTRDTTATDLVFACLEGVTLRLRAVLDLIRHVRTTPTSPVVLVASGAALEKNGLWRQMLADCTGMTVIMDADSQEGTSRGVALLAAARSHEDERLVVSQRLEPNELAKAYWDNSFSNQERLIEAVSCTW